MKSAYLGYHAFSVLISSFSSTDKLFNDWKSLRNIWRHFKNDRIRLVTCAKDLETDIILWLNKQGCCVTDTLRAVEAIEEFDKWGLYGREETKQWKRYLMYYEQIDLLPQSQDDSSTKYGSGNESDQEIMLVLNNILRPGEKADKYCHFSGGEYDILRDCLKDLHLWYEDEQWNDLKATYYELNWDIFMAVLEARHAKPGVTDNETIRNRALFGLLNRGIGLCKKSSSKLPVDDSHIDFIIKMVLQKYVYDENERETKHLFNCIKHGIPFFVTTNAGLIERFYENRSLLLNNPLFSIGKIDVLSPLDFEGRLAEDIIE